jgi:uridine kinase
MNKPFVIGIAGGSGSGKTTFVNRLRTFFNEDEVCLLSQDNYYKKREEQASDENNQKNFDLPSSFREQDFVQDVKKLLAGETINIMEYTFNNSLATAKKIVYKPAKVLIIEGLFVYHFEEIAKMMDLKLFVDASPYLNLIRRIRRDRAERNYPLEDVLYRYEHHVYPAFEQYILPYKKTCDIVLNNDTQENLERSLEVIKAYIACRV